MARRLTKQRVATAGGLLLAYVLVMMFGGCADWLILFPSTEPVDAAGAQRRLVPWNGGEVEVWVAQSPGAWQDEPEAYVLEFTGNATRAEWIAAYGAVRWGERPVELWAVNYPGYGGSTGPARLALIPPAALAAFDAMKAEAGERPIIVSGNSLGTTAALHVAANRPVQGLMLQNPPPLQDLIIRRFGWWNLWLAAWPIARQVPAELNSLATAAQVEAPAVFLLSERDEIVPPAYQRKVVDAHAGPQRIIPLAGADHNAPVEGTALQELEAAMDWLLEARRAPER